MVEIDQQTIKEARQLVKHLDDGLAKALQNPHMYNILELKSSKILKKRVEKCLSKIDKALIRK